MNEKNVKYGTGRVLGEVIPVSVGTALALEAILNSNEIKSYDSLYLNVQTLHRNYHGSFNGSELPDLPDYIAEFYDEIERLLLFISDSLGKPLKPVFYIATNKSLASKCPRAKLRFPSTDKQKNYESLDKRVVEAVIKKFTDKHILIYDMLIKGNNSSALIVTHHLLDLLSLHTFRKLTLLESHTGALKARTQWSSKLNKHPDIVNIPFNILTVQILGDNGNKLKQMDRPMVNALFTMAKDYHWSSSTTLEKIKFDTDKLKDRFLASVIKEMCNVKISIF